MGLGNDFFSISIGAITVVICYAQNTLVFSSPSSIIQTFIEKAADGSIWRHIGVSLFRVFGGFTLGFVIAIPVAFLMGWYSIFRNLVEPWIQFVRNIPPIAYIPLVIAGVGVGEEAFS